MHEFGANSVCSVSNLPCVQDAPTESQVGKPFRGMEDRHKASLRAFPQVARDKGQGGAAQGMGQEAPGCRGTLPSSVSRMLMKILVFSAP